jgi:hypothetical protein
MTTYTQVTELGKTEKKTGICVRGLNSTPKENNAGHRPQSTKQ